MSTTEHKGAEITNPSLANTQGIPHSNRTDGIATTATLPQKKTEEIFLEKIVIHVKVKYDIFFNNKKTCECTC